MLAHCLHAFEAQLASRCDSEPDPWRPIGIWLWQMFSGEYEQAMRSFPGPVMLIGSYRSFPCVGPLGIEACSDRLRRRSPQGVITTPGFTPE